MTERLKASFYNFVLPYDGETYLAFNAMSGAFARMTSPQHQRFTELLADPNGFATLSDKDRDLLESAKRAQFLVDEASSEYDLIVVRSRVGRYSANSFSMTIMPTLYCNFSCPYCYENPEKGQMTDEAQERLIQWTGTKVQEARRMHVAWFGGEPLLARRVVRNLSHRFQEICLECKASYGATITTNAYCLSKRAASELDGLGITLLQVTVDGPPSTHNMRRKLRNGKETFDRIIQNLQQMCQCAPSVRVLLRVNYDAGSFDQVPELFPLIDEPLRSRATIFFRQVFPPPQWWDKEAPTRESSVARDVRRIEAMSLCEAAQDNGLPVMLTGYSPQAGYCEADYINHFVVDPQLDLHKCTVAFDKEHRIGYIDHEGKAVLDSSMLTKWMLRESAEKPMCRDCKILPLCGGGCGLNAICTKGKPECNAIVDLSEMERNLKLLYRNKLIEMRRREKVAVAGDDQRLLLQ